MSTSADLPTKISTLQPGDHLCCIYETEEEHRALLTPYLRQGLERNEKVVYIVDARTAETVLGYLREDGLDPQPYLDRGQLAILTVSDAYMREGAFIPDRMISFLRKETDRAVGEGYGNLRVTGEMSWALRRLPGSNLLIEYESKLNNFFPGSRCLALCQYDKRRFSPEILLQVLATHPIAVIGTEVYENFHFVPPETFLTHDFSTAILGHWIEGLRIRRLVKAREDALRESEGQFRAIFENSMDGILFTVPDGGILRANPAACEMLLRTEEEVCKAGRAGVVDLSDPRLPVLLEERARRGRCNGELIFIRKDGTKFPVELSSRVYKDRYGNSQSSMIFRDITERKKAEETLRASDREFAESQRIAHVGNWDWDAATDTIRWSDEYYRIYSIDSNLPTPNYIDHLKVYTPESRERLDAAVKRTMQAGETYELDLEVADPAGPTRWICARGEAKRDSRGRIVGLRGTALDITERKQAEEEKRNLERQVQQAQRLESLGVLAGGIAHDFNNLLMAVLGHAELALDKISPMSAARENLTEITRASRRASELCSQMLAYAGKSSFSLERVGLRELVEEMAHLLKTAISKKAILNLHLERGLPPIEADPSQIRQVVMNLIINASEAIGDRSGVITVAVGATRCDEEYLQKTVLPKDLPTGLYVYLEVTDTGGGMDAETRSRIFDPFFSTKFTGRGLGLAAVLGIVRVHKGALKVYSEPGKGTTFKVLFPALTEGEEANRPPEPTPLATWRGKGTILLVDDEESLVALGAQMLEHLGFSVLSAPDGLQAVDLYRERGKEIDLVLMDLTMPHMDGAEAFGELRRLNPDVRVVLASGYSHEDVASRFAGKGLAGVLQKPYTLAKLRELLAGMLPKRLDGEG